MLMDFFSVITLHKQLTEKLNHEELCELSQHVANVFQDISRHDFMNNGIHYWDYRNLSEISGFSSLFKIVIKSWCIFVSIFYNYIF